MYDECMLREEGVDGESSGVAEDADDHGCAPTQFLERGSEYEHGQNFRHLSDAHDGHDQIAGSSHLVAAQKLSGPVEVAVMNEGIEERHDPEDEDKRMLEKLAGL